MKKRDEIASPASISIKRVLLVGTVIYFLAFGLFYFLAGENLRVCESRGNVNLPAAEYTTGEMTGEVTLEQSFVANIQRLEQVSLQWTTSGRKNTGKLTMKLYRAADGQTLLEDRFDLAGLADRQLLTLAADAPLEGLDGVPLVISVHADSPEGQGGALMMHDRGKDAHAWLSSNGEPVDGMLCLEARGSDYSWIGVHYWELAAGLWLALALVTVFVLLRVRSGKRSYIYNAVVAMRKYRFLIRQLVSRDFKTKYKRSVLGVFWSFLNPLLMMLVQYYVFSMVFRNDVPNFAAYLIIGTVMFNFFSESVGMSLTSIVGNSNLIDKVYIPKYIYPLTRILSSLVNLVISFIPMLIVCAFTGIHFQRSVVLTLFFVFCLVVFCFGMGLLLSTSMVFFRDTQFLWTVLVMMWMYATPIFYPETILPEGLKQVLAFNPMYVFIKSVRICIMNGVSPEPMAYVKALAMALGFLLVGALVFRENQDKFVLYL